MGLAVPNLQRYAIPLPSPRSHLQSTTAAEAPTSPSAAPFSTLGLNKDQTFSLDRAPETDHAASAGGEQGGLERASCSAMFSRSSEEGRGEHQDEIPSHQSSLSRPSLRGSDREEVSISCQKALAASVSALLRSRLGEEFLSSSGSYTEDEITDDTPACRYRRTQALRSLAEALLAGNSKGSRGAVPRGQRFNHQASVSSSKRLNFQELLRQLFRQSFLRPGRRTPQSHADQATCDQESGEGDSLFSVPHSEDANQRRYSKLFETGESSSLSDLSRLSDFEALLKSLPEMGKPARQASVEEKKALSSFSRDSEGVSTIKRLPKDECDSSFHEKKRQKLTDEREGNTEKPFSPTAPGADSIGDDVLQKSSLERGFELLVSSSPGTQSDSGTVWTNRLEETGVEDEKVPTGKGPEETVSSPHFSGGRVSGCVPDSGSCGVEDSGKIPKNVQEGLLSGLEKTREGAALSGAGGGWEKGAEWQQRHSFSGDATSEDVLLRLTQDEWALMDHLDSLDFEAADLDEVMTLVNKVPKVRGKTEASQADSVNTRLRASVTVFYFCGQVPGLAGDSP